MRVRPDHLAEMILEFRLALGESQEDFGRRYGVGRSAVRMWERGDNLKQAAKILSVIYDATSAGVGLPGPPASSSPDSE